MCETLSVKMTTYKVLKRVRVRTLIKSGFNGDYRSLWFTEAKNEEPAPIHRCWNYLENLNENKLVWILDYYQESVRFVGE
jgi:hypothetical protein